MRTRKFSGPSFLFLEREGSGSPRVAKADSRFPKNPLLLTLPGFAPSMSFMKRSFPVRVFAL
jgi:hypothetical protein